jgi:hypothetical protein
MITWEKTRCGMMECRAAQMIGAGLATADGGDT